MASVKQTNVDQNMWQECETRETHTKVYAVNLRERKKKRDNGKTNFHSLSPWKQIASTSQLTSTLRLPKLPVRSSETLVPTHQTNSQCRKPDVDKTIVEANL